MKKFISFFMLVVSLGTLVGCESHRDEGIQEEQEKPQVTRPIEGSGPTMKDTGGANR